MRPKGPFMPAGKWRELKVKRSLDERPVFTRSIRARLPILFLPLEGPLITIRLAMPSIGGLAKHTRGVVMWKLRFSMASNVQSISTMTAGITGQAHLLGKGRTTRFLVIAAFLAGMYLLALAN